MRQIALTVSHLTPACPVGYRSDSAGTGALREWDQGLMSEFFEARIGPLSFRRNCDEQ
jgi:hypothetical protein